MDAEVGELAGGVVIDAAARRYADLDLVEVAAVARAGLADCVDVAGGPIAIQPETEPSVAQPGGAAERVHRVAAEDNRRAGFLNRTRFRPHSGERHETSPILRLLHRPQRLHRADILLGA